MDHKRIEADDIIDSYLTGGLPPEVRSHFEDHLLICPECMTEVEETKGLISVLADATAAGSFAFLPAALEKRVKRDPPFLVPLPAWGLVAVLSIAAILVCSERGSNPLATTAAVHEGGSNNAAPGLIPLPPLVQVETYRSGSSQNPTVQEHTDFRLRLDVRGVPVRSKYAVE